MKRQSGKQVARRAISFSAWSPVKQATVLVASGAGDRDTEHAPRIAAIITKKEA